MRGGGDRGAGVTGLRAVEQAPLEHRLQDAVHVVVEGGLGDLAAVDRVGQRGAVGAAARHLHVQAVVGAGDRRVGGSPVRGDEAAEPHVPLEDPVLQRSVLARVRAVDERVRAHRRVHAALLDRGLEGGRVDLPLGAGRDDGVVRGGVAVGLLVVDGVVLHLCHRALALDALDVGGGYLTGQVGVLAERFERPAPPWVADDVDGRREHHVRTLAPLLRAEHLPVLLHQGGVPTGRSGHRRRHLGHPVEAVACADRSVLQVDGRDAEPGVAVDAADVAAGRSAVHHRELLCLGHRGEQFVGAGGRRLGGVRPWAGRGVRLAGTDGQAGEDEERGGTGAQQGSSGEAHVDSRGTGRADI